MDERRKAPRIIYKKIVQVTILKAPGRPELLGDTYICDACDISTGGICIIVEIELPKDTILRMKLSRPAPHKSFLMPGLVRWIRVREAETLWDAGIEFEASSPRSSQEWLDFIAHLGAKSGPA